MGRSHDRVRRRPGTATSSVLLAAVLFLGSAVCPATAAEKLAPKHRQWLERDVVYIITKEEREAFLKLASDEARDKFIARFWDVRNPTPGAPTNPYREEHYRRLEYANQYFGRESATDGWRTDRGRVYITLGAPQQRAPYTGYQKIRPMEIWFYSSGHAALAPFFYVVFYQRENIGDYRLYSPYFDGPEKLVTTLRVVNDRVGSLKVIEQEAGREVARTTLSLLPDEPVDWQTATSSLQSDLLLSSIRNLANHPLSKADLDRRRQILESVTSRLIFGGEFLNLLAVPLRDAEGNTNLHYALRLKRPEDFAVGQAGDNRYYYSVSVTARVFSADNKLIYTQERSLSRYFDKSQFEQIKDKIFGFEGWMPLPPGRYKLEFLFTNLIRQTAYRVEKEVLVPETPTQGIRLTQVVPFSEAEALDPAKASLLPFTAAGIRFTPLFGEELHLAPGQDLKIFYQIWLPANEPAAHRGKKLSVEYVYGRPGVPGDTKVVREEIGKEQFDRLGSLVNGKKISLTDSLAGNYLLTVNLTDPETQQKANAALGFRITNAPAFRAAWDILDEEMVTDARKGVPDYQRGLCYLALGQKEKAPEWFRRAFQKDPGHEQARGQLVDLYFAQQAFAQITDLYVRSGITGLTKEQTILRMAESFDKLGNTRKAIELLESALNVQSASGPLYLALAAYYQRLGESQKATELERKGKSLLTATSPVS